MNLIGPKSHWIGRKESPLPNVWSGDEVDARPTVWWRETRSAATRALQDDVPDERNPLPRPDRQEILVAIEECCQNLNAREEFVFRSRIEDLMSFVQLAESLRITRNNLHVIYHQSRQKMRRCLEKKGFRV